MKLRTTTGKDLAQARCAFRMLRNARDTLRKIGCSLAAEAAQRAVKSADGALRHLTRTLGEDEPAFTGRQPDHKIAQDFPFEMLAHFSQIDGKPYVEIDTSPAGESYHDEDGQPLLRLYVNDEHAIEWPDAAHAPARRGPS